MGAWYCEGEGCNATIAGSHPMEYGDEGRSAGWDPDVDPMLCRACTAEAAFATVEQWVADRLDGKGGPLQGAAHELQRLYGLLHEQRAGIERAETFNPSE